MTMLTKSAVAAAILAVMAGAAHAQSAPAQQSGESRQIQVLPAPEQQQVAQSPQASQQPAQAPAPATDGAAAQPEQAQPDTEVPQEAPKAAPKAAPQEAKPAPKFAPVPPKFVAPKRPAYAEGYGYQNYGYAGYGYPKRYRNHCH